MATLKRSMPSLIGGIVVAIFVFILWLLVAGSTSPTAIIAGAAAAIAVGAWVRLADL